MKKNNKFTTIEIMIEMIGLRLDKALSYVPEISSRSRAEYLIENQFVLVNNINAKSAYRVREFDIIQVSFPEKQTSTRQVLDLDLDILFEDKDVIVINKPAGLVVHPAAGHQNDTLVNALLAHTKDLSMKFGEDRPGIVHRLDRDTSGLLVVAKNDFSHEKLVQQFKQRSISRTYYAACIGGPLKTSGKIESYIARHPIERKKFASVKQEQSTVLGKWSATNYWRLVFTESGLSYLKLKLETGRTHQIRVHLSEMGCPIIGDELYGAFRKIKNIVNKEDKEIVKSFPRFALHAAELGFKHPRTEENLQFAVNWPNDLFPLLKKMNLIL